MYQNKKMLEAQKETGKSSDNSTSRQNSETDNNLEHRHYVPRTFFLSMSSVGGAVSPFFCYFSYVRRIVGKSSSFVGYLSETVDRCRRVRTEIAVDTVIVDIGAEFSNDSVVAFASTDGEKFIAYEKVNESFNGYRKRLRINIGMRRAFVAIEIIAAHASFESSTGKIEVDLFFVKIFCVFWKFSGFFREIGEKIAANSQKCLNLLSGEKFSTVLSSHKGRRLIGKMFQFLKLDDLTTAIQLLVSSLIGVTRKEILSEVKQKRVYFRKLRKN